MADEENFGTGEVGGDDHWSEPVYGNTDDGRDITFSQGQGPREGETLVAEGHVSMSDFYGRREDGNKGHDHLDKDGNLIADRGRWY